MNAADRQKRIDSARAILDFCEQHPDIKLPFDIANNRTWTIYTYSPESFTAFAAAVPSPRIVLEENDGVIYATQSFGDMELKARVDISEIEVPVEWTAPNTVVQRVIDTNLIALAINPGA